MKRYTLIILSVIFITSCAAIRRTIQFETHSENWEKDSPHNSTYLYSRNSDSIYVSIADFHNLISIGPAPIPVFPMFLFSWSKKAPCFKIDMFFDINKPYIINFNAIKFMSNNKHLLPLKIEQINKRGNQATIVENNILTADTHTHFRIYFDKKVKKIKQLDIHIDSLTINGKTIVLPTLMLNQSKQYEYNPLMVGHF